MLQNANVLSLLLVLVAVLLVVGTFIFGFSLPFYVALILTPIAMVIMVVMLATFPKDPS